jgi:hypothetical protein
LSRWQGCSFSKLYSPGPTHHCPYTCVRNLCKSVNVSFQELRWCVIYSKYTHAWRQGSLWDLGIEFELWVCWGEHPINTAAAIQQPGTGPVLHCSQLLMGQLLLSAVHIAYWPEFTLHRWGYPPNTFFSTHLCTDTSLDHGFFPPWSATLLFWKPALILPFRLKQTLILRHNVWDWWLPWAIYCVPRPASWMLDLSVSQLTIYEAMIPVMQMLNHTWKQRAACFFVFFFWLWSLVLDQQNDLT